MKTRINSIFLFLVFTSQIFISTSSPLFADEIYLQNEQSNLPNNEKKSSASIVNNNDEKKNKAVEEGIWNNWKYLKDTSTKTITLTGYEKTSESLYDDIVIPTSNDFGLPDYNVQIGFAGLQSAGRNASTLRTSGNGAPIKVIDSILDDVFRATPAQTMDLCNLDVSGVTNMAGMFADSRILESLKIGNWNVQNVTDMNSMFYNCTVTQLDIGNWNVQNVTNMSSMFYSCHVTQLDIGDWNVQNVTDMNMMFGSCHVTQLDIGNWNVQNVTNMRGMFNGCHVTQLDIGNWNVQNVTDMSGIFCATYLSSLDIRNWNMQNVNNLQKAFAYSDISYLNLQNWHLQNDVNTNMLFYANRYYAFLLVIATDERLLNYNYTADKRVKFGTLKIDPKLGNFNGQATDSLFDYAINQPLTDELINQQLEKGKDRLTLNGHVKFDHWQAESTYATTLEKANGVYNAVEVNQSAITLKNSTTKKYIGDLYGEAELRENIASLTNKEGEDSLTSDRSKVTITAVDQDGKSVALNDLTKKIGTYTITYSYNGVEATESLTVEFVGWQYDVSDHTIILRKYTGTSENVVIPASGDFGYPDYNVQIDFAGLQSAGENAHILRTSGNGAPIKVISSSLKGVFSNNENLQTVDLDNLDVSNVVNMYNLFRNCNKLSSLNIKDWDTRNVTTICGMFFDCRSLTSLDVSQWNIQSVTDVNGMFSGCSNLQNLDISQWDTRNIVDMGGMFFNCQNLQNLDISQWNVQNVNNIQFAFAYSALSYLNLQNWHLRNDVNLTSLFAASSKTPLLVITTDDKLLDYNYTGDNRVKFGTLKIDPKLGNFNGQVTDSLFDYTINQPLTDELINQQLEKGKDRLTLNGHVKFDHWQAESTYATTLKKANGVYNAVEVNQSAITLKNSTTKKYIGDLYGEAELRENIASLTNKEGEDSLTSDRSKVTITAVDQDGKSVALNDLTKKIGTYTITYSYNGVEATESLSVDDGYYVIIPQKYQFDKSPTKEKLNGEVKVVSSLDPTKEFIGNSVIDMTVSSSNNFIFDNGGEYKLTTGSKDLAKKDLVGHFSLANLYPSSKEIEAKLVKRGKKISSIDSLTFNWRRRKPAAKNSIRIGFLGGFLWTENGCLFQNNSDPLLKDAKIQKDDGSIENLRMDVDRNCYILSEILSTHFMFTNVKIVTSFSKDCWMASLDNDSYSGIQQFEKGKQYKFTIHEDGSVSGEEVLVGNSE